MEIGCWNEWSEGCYLLPDLTYGYGKLKALAEGLGVNPDLAKGVGINPFIGISSH